MSTPKKIFDKDRKMPKNHEKSGLETRCFYGVNRLSYDAEDDVAVKCYFSLMIRELLLLPITARTT